MLNTARLACILCWETGLEATVFHLSLVCLRDPGCGTVYAYIAGGRRGLKWEQGKSLCAFAYRAWKENQHANEIMNFFFLLWGLKNQQDNVDLESKPADLHSMTLPRENELKYKTDRERTVSWLIVFFSYFPGASAEAVNKWLTNESIPLSSFFPLPSPPLPTVNIDFPAVRSPASFSLTQPFCTEFVIYFLVFLSSHFSSSAPQSSSFSRVLTILPSELSDFVALFLPQPEQIFYLACQSFLPEGGGEETFHCGNGWLAVAGFFGAFVHLLVNSAFPCWVHMASQ